MLKQICYRTYSDFLMPDRLGIYQALIQNLLDHEYQIHSVLAFWQLLKSGGMRPDRKYAVLRHDVDTDPATARRMWRLEIALGIHSTYYFRKSTVDIPLMQEMHSSACEVSYHYEELATFAKKTGITSREELEAAMPYVRERFRHNLSVLRQTTGIPMLTVASHGDFANRKLGANNKMILEDHQLRRELNIVLEAYDLDLMQQLTCQCADSPYPNYWNYSDPKQAILSGARSLHILIHPRQWHANSWVNLKDDAARCWQAFSYAIRSRSHRRLKDPSSHCR